MSDLGWQDTEKLNRFAYAIGMVLGALHSCKESEAVVEHLENRGVDTKTMKKLEDALKEVSEAFYV